jgi:hypothetical protein
MRLHLLLLALLTPVTPAAADPLAPCSQSFGENVECQIGEDLFVAMGFSGPALLFPTAGTEIALTGDQFLFRSVTDGFAISLVDPTLLSDGSALWLQLSDFRVWTISGASTISGATAAVSGFTSTGSPDVEATVQLLATNWCGESTAPDEACPQSEVTGELYFIINALGGGLVTQTGEATIMFTQLATLQAAAQVRVPEPPLVVWCLLGALSIAILRTRSEQVRRRRPVRT